MQPQNHFHRLEHQQDMKFASTKQSKLLNTVQSLHATIQLHEETISQQNESLRHYDDLQDRWQNQYELLRQQQLQTTTELVAEQASTAALVQTIAGRDEHIIYLKEQIADLQTAVCRMAGWHESIVRPQLDRLRHQFEMVNASYGHLQDHLLDHSDDLQTVLKELNIDSISDNNDGETLCTVLLGGGGGNGGGDNSMAAGGGSNSADPNAASHGGGGNNNNNNNKKNSHNHHNNCCSSTEQDEEPVDDHSAMVRLAQAASHVLE
jgi:hypothetical protein